MGRVFLPDDDAITLAEWRAAHRDPAPEPKPETETGPLSTGQLADALGFTRQSMSRLAGLPDFPEPDDPGCGNHHGKGCRWHPRRWRLETVEWWLRERT